MAEGDARLARRFEASTAGDPCRGQVRWSPRKSLWWSAMLLGWLIGGALYFSWDAILLFLLWSGTTLCLGHSIGMHRKLIHESFACPPIMEKAMVTLGTLVGLGGPFTMMRTHDLRDWAQRQPTCHPYLAHQSGLLRDFWWQIHCDLVLEDGPVYRYPAKLTASHFYRLLERTALLLQLAVGLLLYALGGWGWVAWGCCGRITVSIFGHWCVGYFAHNAGERDWHVEGAAVQGHNLRHLGLLTFGECWHNNHHAFPGSAKLGLLPGQFDPGWLVLMAFERVGLAGDFRLPDNLPSRPELSPAVQA